MKIIIVEKIRNTQEELSCRSMSLLDSDGSKRRTRGHTTNAVLHTMSVEGPVTQNLVENP